MISIEAGFATLAEIKTRLTITDTVDDDIFTSLLKNVSAAFGAFLGRELRRGYGVRDVLPGGVKVARLSRWPIVAIHSVRESSTRDFETVGNYTELVEGTDWIIEPSQRRRPGELGFIRRLNGRFMGSEENPGQTEVIYSAGWKTANEIALEDAEVTITNVVGVEDFAVVMSDAPSEDAIYQISNLDSDIDIGGELDTPAPAARRGVIRFDLSASIMPTWRIIEATLNFKYLLASGVGPSVNLGVMLLDPQSLFSDASALWTAAGVTPIVDTRDYDQASLTAVAITIHSTYPTYNQVAAMDRINETASRGFAAFGWKRATETFADLSVLLSHSESTSSSDRPNLVLKHRNTLVDPFAVPLDLQEACLMQSIDWYQTRKRPGMKAEVMRGIGVASGVSYLKNPSSLLPAVKTILINYES